MKWVEPMTLPRVRSLGSLAESKAANLPMATFISHPEVKRTSAHKARNGIGAPEKR